VGIMTQSVTCYFWVPASKNAQRIIHGTIGFLWLCCAIVGFSLIIRAKTLIDDTHFDSPHERIGLAVVTLGTFQFFIGLSKGVGLLSTAGKLKFMRWHGRFGRFVLILAFVAIGCGLQEIGEQPQGTPKQHVKNETIAVYCLLVPLAIITLFFDHFAQFGDTSEEGKDKYANAVKA